MRMSLYVKQALYAGGNGTGHPRRNVCIQVVINIHVVRRGMWGPILSKDACVDTVWCSDDLFNICIWGSREGNQGNPLGRGGIKIWIRKKDGCKASAGTRNRLKIRWTGVATKDNCGRNTEVGAVGVCKGSGDIGVKFCRLECP